MKRAIGDYEPLRLARSERRRPRDVARRVLGRELARHPTGEHCSRAAPRTRHSTRAPHSRGTTQPIALQEIVGAGRHADGTLYVLDRGRPELRAFVSEGSSLQRKKVAGSGEGDGWTVAQVLESERAVHPQGREHERRPDAHGRLPRRAERQDVRHRRPGRRPRARRPERLCKPAAPQHPGRCVRRIRRLHVQRAIASSSLVPTTTGRTRTSASSTVRAHAWSSGRCSACPAARARTSRSRSMASSTRPRSSPQ